MAHKKSVDFFEGFVELMEYACESAILLNEIFENFDIAELQSKMEEMRAIEHSGDIQCRILMNNLAKEFITPIEREDIMAIADGIDNITDTIEDVLLRLYMHNISSIRDDGKHFTKTIVKCCDNLKLLLLEFHNFRKSERIMDLILEVNRVEEDADKMFTESTHSLYLTCKDPIEIISWDQTLHYLENSCDACEDVSNIVERVIMKSL